MNSQKPKDREEGLATQGSDHRFFCEDPRKQRPFSPLLFLFLEAGQHETARVSSMRIAHVARSVPPLSYG